MRYAGVGNIAATLWSPGESRSLVTTTASWGTRCARCRTFEYALPPQGLLVMHSDGVSTRWQLDKYPGLACATPR